MTVISDSNNNFALPIQRCRASYINEAFGNMCHTGTVGDWNVEKKWKYEVIGVFGEIFTL